MYVSLNTDGQFGDDGPGYGDVGKVMGIRKIDGDFWLYTTFEGYEEFFIVPIQHVLWANTSQTATFYTTGI